MRWTAVGTAKTASFLGLTQYKSLGAHPLKLQMSILVEEKFWAYLEERYPEQYKKVMPDKELPIPLWDEFIIEQARTIGVRILQ